MPSTADLTGVAVYVFRASLVGLRGLTRKLAVREDETLEDVHQLLQLAFVREPAPGRGKQARLTADRGARAKTAGHSRIDATLEDWRRRYGADVIAQAVSALVPIVGDATRDGSPLFAGLQPPPEGWRALVRPPQTLPWYPMVLHRGGYPDGS
ncbi:MAG: hypothetical protein ACLP8S_01855 [Solirubrobacteraceae bacterium]